MNAQQQSHDPTAPVNPAAAATAAGSTAATGGGRLREHAAEEPLTDQQSPTGALKDIGTRFSELAEYVSYYISAKTDGIKVTVRNVGIYAALGVVGALAGATFVVSAVALVCFGIAAALSRLFGSVWIGTLVTGVLFLVLLGVGAMLGMRMLTKGSRERTVRKYGSRQQQQRAAFGTDVRQRSSSPATQ